MPLFILSFLLGDICLQCFHTLPAMYFIFSLFIIVVTLWFVFRNFIFTLLLAFTLGFMWTTWYSQQILSWSLPKEWEGQSVLVTGYISSVPVVNRFQTNFYFSLDSIQFKHEKFSQKTLIKLFSRTNLLSLKVGDKYQFLVRLKRIHSTQNPGGFDFEAWALQKGLRATGTIILSPENKFLYHSWYYPIDQLRQRLHDRLKLYLPHTSTSPWLMALIIGERQDIDQSGWQILKNTGTNHLMAIAGLHIGIIAGFIHFLVSWCWRRFSFLTLRFPAHHAGAIGALIGAFFYSALSGFAIPTQRACIMLCVLIFTLLLRRQTNHWNVWALALFVVLILNPLSVLSESFWLSFGTIALIIYTMKGRLYPKGFWWRWGRIQWVIGIGLMPLTLVLFQQASLISFVANSIAIPWLSFFILPFCFLSAIFIWISPSITHFLLLIADKILTILWMILTWFAALPFAAWHLAIPDGIILFITVLGFLFLLLPRGIPGKSLGIIWLLPLFFYKPIKPESGDFSLTLLDVGQGLSAVVETHSHTLVYDTGAKLNANFDMGESVVVPYLYSKNIKEIDMLVISHGDNDHMGGANAILNAIKVKTIKTSVPAKIPTSFTELCLANQSWEWDGVSFSFLYPTQDQLNLGNDSSCVLKIKNNKHSALLTGDIEKLAEKYLIKEMKFELASSVLVAPHHGSKTSGLKTFIDATNPAIVLYPIGYRNRYHFPHPSVYKAYANIHAKQYNTAESGAIQLKLEQNQQQILLEWYRLKHKRFWFTS